MNMLALVAALLMAGPCLAGEKHFSWAGVDLDMSPQLIKKLYPKSMMCNENVDGNPAYDEICGGNLTLSEVRDHTHVISAYFKQGKMLSVGFYMSQLPGCQSIIEKLTKDFGKRHRVYETRHEVDSEFENSEWVSPSETLTFACGSHVQSSVHIGRR